MTEYRRRRVPGGTFFFTVNLAQRGGTLLTDHADLLRRAYAETVAVRPIRCDAMVVLPDHLHAVWTLPPGDSDFSTRWGSIKSRFSRRVRERLGLPPIPRSKVEKGDAGIWQRRFWEHHVRDAADLAAQVRYCWSDPARHGLAETPADWPFSSFRRDVARGVVPGDWVGPIEEGAFGEVEVVP